MQEAREVSFSLSPLLSPSDLNRINGKSFVDTRDKYK